MEIFWSDEHGNLVPRSDITIGQTHVELVGENHVWVVVATDEKLRDEIYHARAQSMTDAADIVEIIKTPNSIKQLEYSAATIFRPSSTSLKKSKCTNVVWSPFSSASFSQVGERFREGKSNKKVDWNSQGKQEIDVNMHIQIYDKAKQEKELDFDFLESAVESKQPEKEVKNDIMRKRNTNFKAYLNSKRL